VPALSRSASTRSVSPPFAIKVVEHRTPKNFPSALKPLFEMVTHDTVPLRPARLSVEEINQKLTSLIDIIFLPGAKLSDLPDGITHWRIPS